MVGNKGSHQKGWGVLWRPQGIFSNVWRYFWLSVTIGGLLASTEIKDATNAAM